MKSSCKVISSNNFCFVTLMSLLLLTPWSIASTEQSRLALTTDVTWSSKYMLDGFKVGGDSPVWQLAGKTDLYASGFSVMLWTALQADRSRKQYDEQDFFLLYSRDFLKDSQNTINLHGFYDYWIFPNTEPLLDDAGQIASSSKKHGNKFQVGITLPHRIPFGGSFLVPSYNIYQWLYWAQDRADRNQAGAHHEFLLQYDRATPLLIPGATYQYSGGSISTNYNTGAFGVKPGWSHSTASLLSGVYALKSIFTFSLNYQWTYEETINPGNEFWSTFSYIKKF